MRFPRWLIFVAIGAVPLLIQFAWFRFKPQDSRVAPSTARASLPLPSAPTPAPAPPSKSLAAARISPQKPKPVIPAAVDESIQAAGVPKQNGGGIVQASDQQAIGYGGQLANRAASLSGPAAGLSGVPADSLKRPCEFITASCKQAGFVTGAVSSGNGLAFDCIVPIMQGRPQPREATKPLPHISPDVISACRVNNPEYGFPKKKRSSERAGDSVPRPVNR